MGLSTSTIEIEIDGKKLDVEPGSMVIEAADNAGIPIPRFCYHKKLSVAANCRMCLVEVEKVGKPLPACATPVTAGMKVYTQSEKARVAQKAVMEFLLINHPLDCPICDQGGECELQDISLEYGKDASRFTEGKRSVANENIGPLVATEMTRCIQCTRCVRFGEEIAGVRELGALGRGEHLWIGTYIKHSLTSEIAANIIDLCPVGALTSKPFQFTARAWELTQHRAVAPHDCLGSNVFVHSRRQEVMRVVPRDNEQINETWLSDRDRFSYLGINSHKRVTKPLVKVNGEWQEVDWEIALRTVVAKLSGILDLYEPEQIAALISPSATLEEMYLLQKLMRKLGTHNVDHRLHQSDFSDQDHMGLMPGFIDCAITDLESQDNILIFGSHLHHEQPLAAVRVRKAISQGAQVFCFNPIDYDFAFDDISGKITASPYDLVAYLAGLVLAVAKLKNQTLPTFASQLQTFALQNEVVNRAAQRLVESENNLILLGEFAQNYSDASTIRTLVHLLSDLTNIKIAYLTFGANSAGAWVAGAIPHRKEAGAIVTTPGLTLAAALHKKLKAYFLFGVEPDKDLAYSEQALAALAAAEAVIACMSFTNATIMEHAHVVLPISTFAETSGTYINAEGVWQSFAGAVAPRGETRPGWKVLRALANFFNYDTGFDYTSSETIRDEVKNAITESHRGSFKSEITIEKNVEGITRITAWPIYQVDSLVRHAEALQQTPINEVAQVHINKKLAEQLNFHEGEMVLAKQHHAIAKLPVSIDNRIPDNCAYIPAGFSETASLGAPYGVVSLEKA